MINLREALVSFWIIFIAEYYIVYMGDVPPAKLYECLNCIRVIIDLY